MMFRSNQYNRKGETALIKKCQNGDRRAFQQLFSEYKGFVLKVTVQLLGSTDNAEELVQDTFIAIARSIVKFEGKSLLSTWIYRITYTTVMQHIRQKGYQKNSAVGVDHDQIDSFHDEAGATAETDLHHKRQSQALHRALMRLEEKKRAVIVLHDIEGRTMQEIADKVGIALGTVQSRLFHARREMREKLQSESIFQNRATGS